VAASRRLSPLFKLAFFTLLGLTLVFFAAAANHLFQEASYTLTALVGLFAGKVA
jgi:hypothetical protein